MKKLLFATCFFGVVQLLVSQNLTFHHYGLENGLSQQTIRCITKDSNGFLWLGTQDGLNRFDGNNFKTYKYKSNDTLSVSDNFINNVLENHDKTLWIGTANGGICYYNPTTDAFYKTRLQTSNCTALVNDSYGNIYTAILNQGLFVFKKYNNTYQLNNISKKQGFTSLCIKNSVLFVGTKNGKIFKLYNNSLQELPTKLPLASVNKLVYYQQKIWIGTSLGLYVYDLQTKSTTNISLEKNIPNFSEKLFIESIRVKNNTFYIGTDNGMFILHQYNLKTTNFKKISIYKGDNQNINSITSSRVYDIFVDNDLLWVGTNKLDVATLNPPVFTTVNSNTKTTLNNNYVFAILKTKKYTFVGTRNGLHYIDSLGQNKLLTKENTNKQLAYNVIRGIAIDTQNNVWLATTKGVSVIKLEDFKLQNPPITSIYFNENNNKSLSSNKTRSIFIDDKGAVWVTTYGGGLNRFTGNLAKHLYTFKRYTHNTQENSLSSDFVFNITQDAEKNYWITSENGLNKLTFLKDNYKQPKFTIYTHKKNDSTSLQNNTTLHTHHDTNEVLWVATQNGLHKFDKNTETFTQYGIEQGLTNGYVYSILEDAQQRLWLSTNGGLFSFNKKNKTFTNYTVNDGLQNSEFNLGAYFNDQENNTLYFGGVNGYNIFNPETVKALDAEGNLQFTSLKIRDTEINPIVHPKVLDKSINKTSTIRLSYKDFPCHITFSEVDIRPTKNNHFVYALNNGSWNNLANNRTIQLIDLPKGTHILKIQGKTRNTLWQKPPLELTIQVSPPWYKTNLAYFLYTLLLLTLAYAFYKLSLQRQKAQQEAKRLHDLDMLKSQFTVGITHEFRTPLTLILGHLSALKNQIKNSQQSTALNAIEENSNNLLQLVNEMLALATSKKGEQKAVLIQADLVPFVAEIVQRFSTIAHQKNISLHYTHCSSLVTDFDTEKMRQILTNLIGNAFKFSEENSSIQVKLQQHKNTAILQVIDNGFGISVKNLPYIFNHFYRVLHKNKDISGSGIGLALTKQWVTLLGGTITVKSKPNEGSTFTVSLPIKNAAERQHFTIKNSEDFTIKQQQKLIHLKKHSNAYEILIVEDTVEIANFIAQSLQDQYNISFAVNGKEGFKKAQEIIPDIIITDVMMPLINGYELTQKLQETKTTNHIPIIMLTAKAQQTDKLTGIKSGADAYLTKPFQKEELLLRVNSLITKRKKLQEHYRITTLVTIPKKEIVKDRNLVFLNQTVTYIHTNIENPEYNTKKLANDLLMSESQLYKKLKAITNKSTAIFIRTVRLEKAKELLLTTNLSVSEIAYATGFKDPNWFGKAFKETFKESPSKLRNL